MAKPKAEEHKVIHQLNSYEKPEGPEWQAVMKSPEYKAWVMARDAANAMHLVMFKSEVYRAWRRANPDHPAAQVKSNHAPGYHSEAHTHLKPADDGPVEDTITDKAAA